jgi:Na+/proline symporter
VTSLDWTLFAAYLIGLVAIGLRAAGGSRTTSGFFVADRSMPWWAVGLSVMATQASAITLIGTTGKGYADGMRFVQFYFGLPLALLVLAFTFLPLYDRAGVYTAYELLGKRFDAKTRLLTSVAFLALRCLSLGVVIYAPSVVLSMLLGWELPSTVLAMTTVATAYTMLGGIRAVMWTDVAQMLLILCALVACLVVMLARLPDGATLADTLELAAATGKTQIVDLSFDARDQYTLWSGLIGGTFLFLAYFGCDQSQVQRFLAGRSLRANRLGLLFNALFKIPVQLLVLLLGVVLFVVFHFERPPLVLDAPAAVLLEAELAEGELERLELHYAEAHEHRAQAALELWDADGNARADQLVEYQTAEAELGAVHAELARLAEDAGVTHDDTNTVFPYFVLHYLPAGLAGLLLAAIFAAAMSSIDSEVNALSTTSVVDLYRVHVRPAAEDAHYVLVSRFMTLLWGALAALFALYAASLGSVIEAVNSIGSYFYGSLLGVFLLAYGTRRANGNGACAGLLAGMVAVALAERLFDVAWLWLNPIGCAVCVLVGVLVSFVSQSAGNSDLSS